MTSQDLAQHLSRIDGRPYPAYKDLRGRYDFGAFTLSIDRVQGDPFAAPSRLSLAIPHDQSGLPDGLRANRSRITGAENAIAAAFAQACRRAASHLGSGKSGLLAIDQPGQEMLARTCVEIGESQTVVRFMAGLPANGRRILGRAASRLLVEGMQDIVKEALLFSQEDLDRLKRYADACEDADRLRDWVTESGYVAFVADGSILPRASGIDQRPMQDAVPFESPQSLRKTVDLPHAGSITGMAIPEGITLIVGGGYHGKSTLLNAIERGVYNHRPGDGRELVVTRADAFKARAEDGRSVVNVDLSPFIRDLPGGKATSTFSTENASGSTSQAANILEAIECGSRLLLLDEDISATNFLIRDQRMQQLITDKMEPITPFVRRVAALHEAHGVSTILVLGGSSDYFEPAHRVIAMKEFLPVDLTEQAKALCTEANHQTGNEPCLESHHLPEGSRRFAQPDSISPFKSVRPYRQGPGRRGHSKPPRRNVKAQGTDRLVFGTEEIDLSLVAQLVDGAQTRAIGAALAHACDQGYFKKLSLPAVAMRLEEEVAQRGLSMLQGQDLAAFRPLELAAALNRLRSLRCRDQNC